MRARDMAGYSCLAAAYDGVKRAANIEPWIRIPAILRMRAIKLLSCLIGESKPMIMATLLCILGSISLVLC